MKNLKLASIWLASLLTLTSVVSVFAYTPTAEDETLLANVTAMIQNIAEKDSAKLQPVSKKIEAIMPRVEKDSRVEYVLDVIYQEIMKISKAVSLEDNDMDDDDDDDENEEEDDVEINVSQLPISAQNYIASNYTSAIESASSDDEWYEAVLVDGTEVEFDMNGNFVEEEMEDEDEDMDDDDENEEEDDVEINVSQLPISVQNYIASNYTSAIESASSDDEWYEVELVDGTEVEFDMNGNFVEEEIDDEDEDEDEDDDMDDEYDDANDDD